MCLSVVNVVGFCNLEIKFKKKTRWGGRKRRMSVFQWILNICLVRDEEVEVGVALYQIKSDVYFYFC